MQIIYISNLHYGEWTSVFNTLFKTPRSDLKEIFYAAPVKMKQPKQHFVSNCGAPNLHVVFTCSERILSQITFCVFDS